VNKIDGVSREALMPFLQQIAANPGISEIVPVSAARRTGLEETAANPTQLPAAAGRDFSTGPK